MSGVNPTDYKARSGATPRPIDGFQIPHQDGAGVIDAVGAGVDPGQIGQAVWVWFAAATQRWGTAAQWTVVPEHQAVPLPPGASMELGASLGVPAMTAHRCLFADGPVVGKVVLVAGGSGSVGHFAIEMARHAGAQVITTIHDQEKARLAALAGAHQVIDYQEADPLDQIRAISPQVDRVIEVNFQANLDLDLGLAGPGTVVVTYSSSGDDPTRPVRACMAANVCLRFVLLYGVPRSALEQASRDVSLALGDGVLTELPVQRFALNDIVAAHEAAEAGPTGKVIIDVP